MTKTPINKPEITIGINRYSYWWSDIAVRVQVDRIEDEGMGEVSVYQETDTRRLLTLSRVNLMSNQSCSQLSKRLEKNLPDVDWDSLITCVAYITMEEHRKGEPAVPIGKKPAVMKIEYQLYPILEMNQPTTLYSIGGSGKSYTADLIACLVQLGATGFPGSPKLWLPTPANVLYLDWEASFQDHERRVWAIKKGLGITTEETFLYRRCFQPLVNDLPAIQRMVSDNKIGLVIIDSQMAASGNGQDPAQQASQYYNALRSLHCTSLTIDHVNKSDWKGNGSESTGPYGSVVKYNRSRSQFELRKSQTVGSGFLELSLIHRKNNDGRLLQPMGIRINFNEDAAGDLDSVTFTNCEVADNPVPPCTLSVPEQILAYLKRSSGYVKDIAEAIDKTESHVRKELTALRAKNKVVNIGDNKWGLAYKGEELPITNY